jgi:putative hydrolase of the HAD superfamily
MTPPSSLAERGWIVRWSGLVVFDLDDTLYLERDFAHSGFIAADRWLVSNGGPSGLAEACRVLFETGHRGRIFDEALERLGGPADPTLVGRLVEVYRGHEPRISLAADAARYLGERGDASIGALITDGQMATQQAKVRALGLESRLGRIVYTGALGPGRGKPHPEAFERIEAWWASRGRPLAYVADNPVKDFVTPRARGWLTIQVERPERVHRLPAPDAAHEAHARIASFDQLDACLLCLQGMA